VDEKMKKILMVIMAITMTALLLAGCGSATMEESVDKSYRQDSGEASTDYYGLSDSAPEPAAEPMANELEYSSDDGGYYEEGRKAIKTADAQIEVINFQKAYDAIKAMIGNDGYIEETNIWKTPSYHNGEQIMLTNGSIRIRIKQEKFTSFTEGLSTIGTVLSSRALTDDISDRYYDTEARLELLRDEKERLEQYAEDIDDPEIFFQTQSRITQVIYEMESLQGTLKKWDSRVEFSTVSITISEKHPDEDPAVSKPKGFFEKIWDNMKGSVGFLGDVVVFLFGILPVLLVIAGVVTVLVIIVKKTAGKKAPPDKE
jgi:flagellar basal body-associated protein FliL